jgi:hypothetical protein
LFRVASRVARHDTTRHDTTRRDATRQARPQHNTTGETAKPPGETAQAKPPPSITVVRETFDTFSDKEHASGTAR